MGRRILQHESGRAAFHGPPQEPRPAECRENEGPAGWERPAQLAGGRDAVTTGHLDVEQRDVGLRLRRQREDLIRPVGLGDDFDITLHGQQSLQRTTHHRLVLGD